jgi:hypothetical protein
MKEKYFICISLTIANNLHISRKYLVLHRRWYWSTVCLVRFWHETKWRKFQIDAYPTRRKILRQAYIHTKVAERVPRLLNNQTSQGEFFEKGPFLRVSHEEVKSLKSWEMEKVYILNQGILMQRERENREMKTGQIFCVDYHKTFEE